ncbi:MAG: hypothetical protein A2X55_07755 [Nitrospirae bacterium GWB2_47_37]|nr:MAG: hypothetical protein A2X55_07755 [Nitrospirae bacterium GWB2_47_37]
MTLRLKNSNHQSCRFCASGGSEYKVEEGGDTFYTCEAHRLELYSSTSIDPTPEPEPKLPG